MDKSLIKAFVIPVVGFAPVFWLMFGGHVYMAEAAEPAMFKSEHDKVAKQRVELATGKNVAWDLSGIAKDDVNQGNFFEATEYGNKLLAYAAQNKDSTDRDTRFNVGIAIHDGNIVLGRVALKRGDKEEAKRRLLAAGLTPGSATLDSFGPNMLLARELYHAGEGATVIQYLHECKVFNSFNAKEIDGWISCIQNHQEPDFGANIFY